MKNVNSELVQNSQADECEAPGSGISRTSPKLVADASSKLANLAGVGEEILNLTPRLGKKSALGSGDDDMIIFDEGPSPRSGHYVSTFLLLATTARFARLRGSLRLRGFHYPF